MKRKITKVAIIGAGFMGRQIAARAAVYGTEVRLHDVAPDILTSAEDDVKNQVAAYFFMGAAEGDPAEAQSRISFHPEMADALSGAHLVLEAVPENLGLKRKLFAGLDALVPADCVIATNSSSIPISRLESAVVRKERLMNVHFYGPVPKNSFVDLMRGSMTDERVFGEVKEWIGRINCVPLEVRKECMGFVFNRIWHAVKRECLASWAGGHADYRDIDRAWMIWSGMPLGPFAMMDYVGLDVVYDIEMAYFAESGDMNDRPPDKLKEMIDRRERGLKDGKGFYDWKDPEFAKTGFTGHKPAAP